MRFNIKINSSFLTKLALLFWVFSLPLPVFILYTGEVFVGFQILMIGWLSLFNLNFAWLANLLFFYGCIKLSRGKNAVMSAFLSMLISLDTFRISEVMLNEGGAKSHIHGYGYGWFVWFLSLTLLFAATVKRSHEKNNPANIGNPLLLGLIPFIAAFGTTAYLSFKDKMAANPAEREHLTWATFKRGKVCSAPTPKINNPIFDLSGPLRIDFYPETAAAPYPFSRIDRLLTWGIPIIRVDDRDYRIYKSTPNGNIIISTPANENPSAVLEVRKTKAINGATSSIHAKLTNMSNETVFYQTWTKETQSDYCPNYESFPSESEAPRNLLIKALNLTGSDKQTSPNSHDAKPEKLEGEIMSIINLSHNSLPSVSRNSPNPLRQRSAKRKLIGTNCPPDTGWDYNKNKRILRIGRAFTVNDITYYLPGPTSRAKLATCSHNSVYLYNNITTRSDTRYLSVKKHDLTNFNLEWHRAFIIKDMPDEIHFEKLRIQSLREYSRHVILELIDIKTGKIILLRFPLQTSPDV